MIDIDKNYKLKQHPEGKVKNKGEVYTPSHIVSLMLDHIGYNCSDILNRHIIDNSCGNGAFLTQIVERYINIAFEKKLHKTEINHNLSTFIHGIEIDENSHNVCIAELNKIANKYGIVDVSWDIINADTLTISKYNNKMDFVIGNPPYVRVHNLQDSYNNVKQFNFAKSGMTDLFIVFFEIGFNMLSKTGKMCLITPNSYFNSIAGLELRKQIQIRKNLISLIDLGHYQPFDKITTYTAICLFDNNKFVDSVDYYTLDDNGLKYIENIDYKNLFLNNTISLIRSIDSNWLDEINRIYENTISDISVKNGFATLADNVFINNFTFNEAIIIDIIKSSTGKWSKCIFPYDDNGNSIEELVLRNKYPNAFEYLQKNKEGLEKRSLGKNTPWYAFGRSQAIKDVFVNKIAISPLVKTKETIKLELVPAGSGVYGGLYIISPYSLQEIKEVLITDEFITYVSLLKKYKNGGYYSFSSTDLKKYLVYKKGGDIYSKWENNDWTI